MKHEGTPLNVLARLLTTNNWQRLFVVPLLMSFAIVGAAKAQFYPQMANLDFGVGATQQYTTTVNDGIPTALSKANDSVGLALTSRYHPFNWVGFQIGYSRSALPVVSQKSRDASVTQEVSAAYLLHAHWRRLQPFLALGGSEVFSPKPEGGTTSTKAGVVDLGFDVPLPNPHFGFTGSAHTLLYRPSGPLLSTAGQWVVNAEPSLKAYIRF